MSNPYNGTGCGYDGCGYGIGVPMPSSAAPLLLDELAATYGAWSIARKIRTAYNGPLIRVRESGGNTETDINAANGVLDEAALASHCGANSGYITKVYNQDAIASTLDWLQTTTTIQPIIVESGTIVKQNGKPAAKFVTTSSHRMRIPSSAGLFKFLHDGTKCWIASALIATDNAANKRWLSTQTSSSAIGATLTCDSSELLRVFVGNGSALIADLASGLSVATQSILSVSIDGDATAASRLLAYANGTASGATNVISTAPSTSSSSGDLMLGSYSNGTNVFNGLIHELVIWPTDESASRAAWEADMADFYGVTLA